MLNYLTCGILSPFCLKSGFWAILKEFELAYVSPFFLCQGKGVATRRLLIFKFTLTVPNNRRTREESLFWKGFSTGAIFSQKITSLRFQTSQQKGWKIHASLRTFWSKIHLKGPELASMKIQIPQFFNGQDA